MALDAVVRCGFVDGATRVEVQERLGLPRLIDLRGRLWRYGGGRLAIWFEQGRVVSARLE